jgi:hypothetical protein
MIYPDPVEFLLLSMPELKVDLEARVEDAYGYTWETASVCAKLMELGKTVKSDFTKGTPPFKKSKHILAVLEEFLQIHGDQDLHNSLQVCFFEGLLNKDSASESAFKTFISFLGPESVKVCKQNDAGWGCKTPFLYDTDTPSAKLSMKHRELIEGILNKKEL